MIRRKADKLISDFLLNDRRALLVTGARQVGKTFSIRKVGRECFNNVVEVNFIEHPDAADLFSNATSAKELLLRLSAFTHKPLVPGKTLVFFDEVQVCKDIITAIKFLVDEGSYKYVMSGSLLGVELDNLRSVPVGYMDEIEMCPVDLQEFFEAIGIGNDVIKHLRKCFEEKSPVDDFIHQRMLEAVRLYLIVGGMPAAVQKYLDTNNLRRVFEEQRGIIRTYKRDITQYALNRKLQIEEIYDLVPSELNAKNKRFILKNLNEKARFSKYEDGFLWLKDAGVAIPTFNVEEPRIPLLLSKQRNLFKLFSNDVGLLAAMYGGNIQTQLLGKDANINFGSVYENLVAQELYAHGFAMGHSLYYFNNKKQGELDFVIEYDNHVLPIEVKSGKDYDRHNALSNVMGNQEYGIPFAYVFCQENVHIKGNITYLPIYLITFLEQTQVGESIFLFDLRGLNT
ncbi:ATP-binding protein [Xylanibacter rodentium]|uniref:ATP-binding protein n=1 Tax=Xylanibacter rodentium TaxID=2736289 RepID=UPI002587587E|nr:AAA family ATPase [Xylanibacter rodentium]